MSEDDAKLIKALKEATAKLDAAQVPARTEKEQIDAILKANGLLPSDGDE